MPHSCHLLAEVLGTLLKEEMEAVREQGVWRWAEDGREEVGLPKVSRERGKVGRPVILPRGKLGESSVEGEEVAEGVKPGEINHVRVAGHPLRRRWGGMWPFPLHRAGARWKLQLQEWVAPKGGCGAPLPGLKGVRPDIGDRAQGMKAAGPATEGARREGG
jgi:hypothetical protein